MKCNGFALHIWDVEERFDSDIFHQRFLFQYFFVPSISLQGKQMKYEYAIRKLQITVRML